MNSYNQSPFYFSNQFRNQNQNVNNSNSEMNTNFNWNNNEMLYDQSLVRDMNICDKKADWKKIMSDRLMKRMAKYREERIDSVRMTKEDIINEVRYEQNLTDEIDEEDMLLSLYFDKLLTLFENDTINSDEYEMEVTQNSNISVCPMCSYPVIKTTKKILCLNLCFEYEIPPFMFHSDFTLDNFIDILNRTYRAHKLCLIKSEEKLQLLMFEDDAHIVCGKCFKDQLD